MARLPVVPRILARAFVALGLVAALGVGVRLWGQVLPSAAVAPPGAAPAGAPPATAEPVVEVRIEGLRTVRKERIQQQLRTRQGRAFDPAVLEEDVRRLNRSRLCVNVKPYTQHVQGGWVVVFQVLERPTLDDVRVVGNETYRRKKLLDEADVRPNQPLDPLAVEEGRRKIEDFYHKEGFGKVRVIVLEGSKLTDTRAVYLINEGPRQRIKWINFVGNTIASGGRLQTQIQSSPPMMWLFKGELNRELVEQDVNRLTAYYRNLGFMKARIGYTTIENEDRDWVTLTFVIDEGPRYSVRNISIVGNQKFSAEELAGKLKLKGGNFFNKPQLDGDISGMQEQYGHLGYVFADVKAETRFLDEPGKLDLIYNISEGARYRVGAVNIEIHGDNPHTRMTAVLNQLTLQPGDILDIRRLRDSEKRLRASQLFMVDPMSGNVPKIVFSPPETDDNETQIATRPRPNFRGQSPDGAADRDVRVSICRELPDVNGSRKLEYNPLWTDSPAPAVAPAAPYQRGTAEEPMVIRGQYTSDVAPDDTTGQRPWTQWLRAPQPPAPPATPLPPPGALAVPSVNPPASGAYPAAANPNPAAASLYAAGTNPYPTAPGGYPTAPAPYAAAPNNYTPNYSSAAPATGPYPTAPAAPRPYPVWSPPAGVNATPTAAPSAGYTGTPAYPTTPGYTGAPAYATAPATAPAYSPAPANYASAPTNYGSPAPAYGAAPPAGGYSTSPLDYGPPAGGAAPNTLAPPMMPGSGTAPPPPSSLVPLSPADPATGSTLYDLNQSPFLNPIPDTRPLPIGIPLTETQTGRLMLGVGVNSDAGLVGSVIIDEQNFDWTRFPRSWEDIRNATAWRGAGQRLRIEAVPGTQVQRYMASFTEPYFLNTDVSLGLSGFYYDRIYTEWNEQRLGGRISLGYHFTKRLSGALTFRAEDVGISNPIDPTIPDLAQVQGHSGVYGFGGSLSHDTRDTPFLATEGHLIQFTFEQVVGRFQYPRAEIELRQYFMLWQRPDLSGRHVLSLTGRAGFVGDDTPIYDRYYAGGFSTIRGFEFRGVSPLVYSAAKNTNVPVGGNFMLLASAEYMFPITQDDMFRGVLFCDSGTVEPTISNWSAKYRVAPGFGFRLSIPAMGPAPLAFDFAFPLVTNPGDHEQVFSFFLGMLR